MRSVLAVLLLAVPLFASDICRDKPGWVEFPKGTSLWLRHPDPTRLGHPDWQVFDEDELWTVLGCGKGWVEAKSAKGLVVWARASDAIDIRRVERKTKSSVSGRGGSGEASDGLLGEDIDPEDANDVDLILGGGSKPSSKDARGGSGAGGDGDRMVSSGGAGLGSGGRAGFGSGSDKKGKTKRQGAMNLGSSSSGHDPRPAPSVAPSPQPRASGLQAGVSDDNKQYPAFLKFLESQGHCADRRIVVSCPHELSRSAPAVNCVDSRVGQRVRIRVLDSLSRSVADARVRVLESGQVLEELRTLADGSALLFPDWLEEDGWKKPLRLEISSPAGNAVRTIGPDGARSLDVVLSGERTVPSPLPVDLLFVLDVTGSMQAQIDQLKNAVSILEMNLTALQNRPRLRFGLVQYRDRGDDFVVRTVPFTEDAESFSKTISDVQADGGGDTPEDLQAALESAVDSMKWNDGGVRLAFLVTDAPPHLDYGERTTYADAAHLARRRGIRIHTVGCGSLSVEGELVLRQIAQATGGKYVFLAAKGERGENEGGAPGAVSHHTGDNWVAERLETALLRLSRDEINQQTPMPPVDSSGWYEARSGTGEASDSVVSSLFRQAFQELRDYSSIPLSDTARLAVLPTSAEDPAMRSQAAWLGQILAIEVSRRGGLRVVERGNLGEVLREQALQMSGAADPVAVGGTGRLLGADLLLLSGLHRGTDRVEIVLKLLRASTGELLSATKARLDPALLP
jgi:hypothetical protein